MRWILAVAMLILLGVAYVVVQLVRPVPAVATSASAYSKASIPGTPSPLSWPAQGQAAFGVEGVGLLDTQGAQTPTPLASVTKLMTAYVVLHDHPLTKTASGPDIPIGSADVTTFLQDRAAGDSVVDVAPGEQLSERQALEALLIPSGDNIATLLADWDAGSETAFVAKMNAAAKQLGLSGTTYTDASGVAPGSESTAESQVKLAMRDMTNPAFRAIVDMPQATLPVAGLQYNIDALLGHDGVIGVKTGFTTSAGGCFVFAATTTIAGKPATVVGAVLHQFATATQPSALTQAFDAATALLTSADRELVQRTVVHKGEVLGHLDAPWSGSVALKAMRSVTLTGIPGQRVTTTVVLPDKVAAPVPSGHHFGTAVVVVGHQRVSVPLQTASPLPSAPLSWKLTNI
ncbi:MAG TPA: hypothetical protein VND62_07730 [Acidimicrobiales bacterium]|nr:hypothetical protein [Acidimicrobiales bacterium]